MSDVSKEMHGYRGFAEGVDQWPEGRNFFSPSYLLTFLPSIFSQPGGLKDGARDTGTGYVFSRALVAIFIALSVVSVGFVGCKVVMIEELTLNITSAQWFLEHNSDQSDSIRLRIKGDTNGERVTIITYGDGLMNEVELNLDADKHFNQVVTIAFSHVGYTPPVQAETTVTAYRGSEFQGFKLQSGNIW